MQYMIKNVIENRDELFALMGNGAVVLTPNNRLSNQLLQDFFSELSSTRLVTTKPVCLPYQTFLNSLFKQIRHDNPHKAHPLVLTAQQQRYLWSEIIGEADDNGADQGLLQQIQEAWRRCQLWQIDSQDSGFAVNPQTRQFQHWQLQFQQQLTTLGAITEEQLVSYLLAHADTVTFGRVIWACFDDYTPQQQCLIRAMQARECTQYQYDLTPGSPTSHLYAANDTQDELLQLIDWLKSRLDAGDARIGVVIPDLQTQLRPLQRLLLRHIPQQQFNISLGESLANYPLISHGLTLLALQATNLSNHHARILLQSPYITGGKAELIKRSQMMQESKALRESEVSFSELIKECNQLAPELAGILNNLTAYPAQASPSEWIYHFKNRLKQVGFPGEYAVGSFTYQCFQRFISLLSELLPMATITPLINKNQALACLNQLAKLTIFQVHKKSTSPIQVLGLLEASGCTFDSVWVTGLTDQCLPQATNLSAFIPVSLQRERLMPHAVPERELQFARQLLQRLQHGSKQSVFSYPRMIGDMPNLPSPLTDKLPPLITSYCLAPKSASALITVNDSYQVPLAANEILAGGTTLLANQAKCPFRAFAAHRLHARPAAIISAGPDASERGQIIHKVMDILWRAIGSQQNLVTLSSAQLDDYISHAILTALEPFISQRSYSFSSLVQEVEFLRLKNIVHACLEWDKQRTPFVVEALEQSFTINLAGINFNVRVDRLDKVGDKKWVIDYKSSLPGKPWAQERPEEPQLLLYALLDETINVLLFLQLKTGHLLCNGLSEDEITIKGIGRLPKTETWPAQQQQWQQQLSLLATELSAGHCPPQPTRDATCQHCDFQSLCRINMAEASS